MVFLSPSTVVNSPSIYGIESDSVLMRVGYRRAVRIVAAVGVLHTAHGDGQAETRSTADHVDATADLPTAASHSFYMRLNQLLREHGFDDFAEAHCGTFYADTMGRLR
jgi:hypothetical protein